MMGTVDSPQPVPQPGAVTFITTEHFTLQGARAATIAEATGRATMFLGSVSGGLIALGLVATATRLGGAFYAFCLTLLPLLTFVGTVSFERTLQSGIEDWGYARRIARLRAYYFDQAPELLAYMLSVPPTERLPALGLHQNRWQGWRSIAGSKVVARCNAKRRIPTCKPMTALRASLPGSQHKSRGRSRKGKYQHVST